MNRIESKQSKLMGKIEFSKLQEEIKAAAAANIEEFRQIIDPDDMGFYGMEGIDDAD